MTIEQFVNSKGFQGAVFGVIVLNAILVGWETYAPTPGVHSILVACLWVFAAELVVKVIAATRTRTLRAFFTDGWNLFDLVVVGASFIPAVGTLGPILRVVRILRALRLVRAVPELRVIVTVLVRSVASMRHIAMLGALMFYIYAVIGVTLFRGRLEGFDSLHEALLTLFRVLTGDEWASYIRESEGQSWAWKATAYHVSWTMLAMFLLVNLIVGAVLNNYQEVHEAERAKAGNLRADDQRLRELVEEMRKALIAREHLDPSDARLLTPDRPGPSPESRGA